MEIVTYNLTDGVAQAPIELPEPVSVDDERFRLALFVDRSEFFDSFVHERVELVVATAVGVLGGDDHLILILAANDTRRRARLLDNLDDLLHHCAVEVVDLNDALLGIGSAHRVIWPHAVHLMIDVRRAAIRAHSLALVVDFAVSRAEGSDLDRLRPVALPGPVLALVLIPLAVAPIHRPAGVLSVARRRLYEHGAKVAQLAPEVLELFPGRETVIDPFHL